MDSSLNGLLLLHFARTASNLTVFNSFIIWNSNFFFFFLLPLQNFGMGIQSTKKLKIKDHAPHTNSLKTSIIKQGFPDDLSTSEGAKLCEFYPTTVLVSPKSAKRCYSLQVDRRAWKYFALLLSKWSAKAKFWVAFVLICWDPPEIKRKYFSNGNQNLLPLQGKKKSVSALCCYLDSSGTELILGRLYNLSVLSREVLASAVSVVQYLQSSELEEISSPFHISIHQLTPKTN